MAVVAEREENAYTLAVQAGLWGYPLAYRIETVPKVLAVKGIGLNSFQKFPRLKSAEDRFVVTPNNLTIDGYAFFDVSDGPVVLFVPKLAEPRWFIVQIGDAFDDVILNVGGNREPVPGTYLLTGPDFYGRVPGDMVEVRSRTNLGFVAVRVAVHGEGDLPGAVEAQEGFHVVPLVRYLRAGIVGDEPSFGPLEVPPLTAPDDLRLFDLLGAAMKCMLPVAADVNDTFVQALATSGLSVSGGFDWPSLDESTLAGMRRAAPMVETIIDERWATMSESVNGWRGSMATGRCSYDWALNAANVKNQVGTELADQVVYANTRVDANDEPLSGAHAYVLHFDVGRTPPVAGMWNLAMYDDDMFFVANEINRVSIGSTTDGLTPDDDDSLTVHIQHDRPDDDKLANWLPAPTGSFNLTMRYYSPLAAVLESPMRFPPYNVDRPSSECRICCAANTPNVG